jgi:hypothetical protein
MVAFMLKPQEQNLVRQILILYLFIQFSNRKVIACFD